MYAIKEKKSESLYRRFSSRFSKCQDTELEMHIAHSINQDISEDMKSMARCISAMIVHGISGKGE